MRKTTEAELLGEIGTKLDRIIGLLVAQQNDRDENEKVKALFELGLDAGSIASVLGLSKNAVNIRKTRMRQSTKKKG